MGIQSYTGRHPIKQLPASHTHSRTPRNHVIIHRQTGIYENRLNSLIYGLYGLSSEDKALIESHTREQLRAVHAPSNY